MKSARLLSLLLVVPSLLLAGCGDGGEEVAEDVPAPAGPSRGVPDDVPLYSEDADAKKIDYQVTDTDILVTMETINGPISPITYYRKLADAGWKIVQDSENDGGTILATKKSRELEITFEALPGGAGTIIKLRTTVAQ
jgi:hypothetical protein